jgi:hypothetical protein
LAERRAWRGELPFDRSIRDGLEYYRDLLVRLACAVGSVVGVAGGYVLSAVAWHEVSVWYEAGTAVLASVGSALIASAVVVVLRPLSAVLGHGPHALGWDDLRLVVDDLRRLVHGVVEETRKNYLR